jgi:hypothetical protein
VVGLGIAAFAAVSAQAAPIAAPARVNAVELGAAPPIELVRQDCGWGWHRRRWRDRWGVGIGDAAVQTGERPAHGSRSRRRLT